MVSSPADLRTLTSARATSPTAPITPRIAPPAARWRTRILVPAAVAAATIGVLAYAARDTFSPRTEVWVAAAIPKSAPITAPTDDAAPTDPSAPTTSTPGAVLVQAPGWIEPSPYATGVPALVEGVVREVLVLEGETVTAGQVVARLVDDDERLRVKAAEATLAERKADVDRVRSSLASAEAQIKVEEANLSEQQDAVDRKRTIVEAGGISAGEFRRMEIRLDGLRAKVAAASRIADESRAALRQAEAAATSANIHLEEATLRLARTEVRTPTGGVVLARLVEPGSRISMSSKGSDSADMAGTVLRLYDPAHLQVRVDVPIADAAKIGVGTPCSISTEASPDTTFRGRIVRAVHEANIQRNTVQFKVSIENPSPILKPEMLARVQLHAPATSSSPSQANSGNQPSADTQTLLIPTSAITTTTAGSGTVWIVDTTSGNAAAHRREVKFAAVSEEGYTLITEGLRLTDRVIFDPPPTLHEGSRLRVLGERAGTTSAATP